MKFRKICSIPKLKLFLPFLLFSGLLLLNFAFHSINTREVHRKIAIHQRLVCSWNNPENSLSKIHIIKDPHAFELADTFQENLCNMQTLRHATLLEDTKHVLLFIDDGFEDKTHCGIGCRFMRLNMALWFAYNNDMSLHNIPNGGWEYTSIANCPIRNHDCYFQSLTSEPLESWLVDSRTKEMISSFDAKMLKVNENHLSVNLWSRQNLDAFREEYNFGALWFQEFQPLSLRSGCWLAAQNLYFLLKPNKKLDEEIEKTKKKLNWNNQARCIAVHVRHGDRSKLNSRVKMGDYVKAIRRLPSVKKILIVTDNAEVIQDAEKNFPEYDWHYTDYERENKGNIGIAMQSGKLNPTKEALNALVNLLLSSECEYFVGRTNSTWFRLMIMLAYGKYGNMPPFDNVLEDWGHGGLRKWGFFGMCTLKELQKEVVHLKERFPDLIEMDPHKIQ